MHRSCCIIRMGTLSVGTEGTTITIDHFGASAPESKILEEFDLQ